MTQCIGSPAQEMAEPYLAGELPETDAEQFENHYLACESCHEHLRALVEVREALAAKPVVVPDIPKVVAPAPPRDLRSRILAFPVPMAILGSMAAVLLAVAVLVGLQRSTPVLDSGKHGEEARASVASPKPLSGSAPIPAPQPASAAAAKSSEKAAPAADATELAQLADLQLPGYQQPQLRGAEAADENRVEFVTGMQAYSQGDCKRTLEVLTKISGAAQEGAAARLYSGLCQLKEHHLAAAQASLEAVTAAGDTPQLEPAEYFLAQTQLLRGDAAGAANWLNRTVALHGDYEDRAQKELEKLPR